MILGSCIVQSQLAAYLKYYQERSNKKVRPSSLTPLFTTFSSSSLDRHTLLFTTNKTPHKLHTQTNLTTTSQTNQPTMALVRTVRLRVPSCSARPGPAIGQALGPLGINMAEFCKQFNEKTDSLGYVKDIPLSVTLQAMKDRSFTFQVKSPPTSFLLKKAAGMLKGPNEPNADKPAGFVTPEMVFEIASVKVKDEGRWHLPLEGVAKSVIGTARSMGIQVRESDEVV